MAARVAVLWHERQPQTSVANFAIDWYAREWRAVGIETTYLFGIREHVPADVLIVHVNLSVVPPRYLEFAQRYPVVLNGRLSDIRKSTHSGLRVLRDSAYVGPVIVKTDRNHGGRPERQLSRFSAVRTGPKSWQRMRLERWVADRSPYRVYAHRGEVPRRFFVDPRFIVERLVTEERDGLFWTRHLAVLGDRFGAYRICSDRPIVTGERGVEAVDPDPRVIDYARRIGLDYGKLDYIVRDGDVHVIDVNKTTGGGRPPHHDVFVAGRRHRVGAIDDLLAAATRR